MGSSFISIGSDGHLIRRGSLVIFCHSEMSQKRWRTQVVVHKFKRGFATTGCFSHRVFLVTHDAVEYSNGHRSKSANPLDCIRLQ